MSSARNGIIHGSYYLVTDSDEQIYMWEHKYTHNGSVEWYQWNVNIYFYISIMRSHLISEVQRNCQPSLSDEYGI